MHTCNCGRVQNLWQDAKEKYPQEKTLRLVKRYFDQAAGLGRSILARKHDRQNAVRLARIGGVFAAVHHVGGVVVDFPKELVAAMRERTKVMFAVRIVVLGEV